MLEENSGGCSGKTALPPQAREDLPDIEECRGACAEGTANWRGSTGLVSAPAK